jgi:hypothetical protein
MDPAAAARAATGETGVVPPSADQRIVDGSAERFEAEIDCLHTLLTALVRTTGIAVNDVWRHSLSGSSLAIEGMHLVELGGVLIRYHAGHHVAPKIY